MLAVMEENQDKNIEGGDKGDSTSKAMQAGKQFIICEQQKKI